MATTKTIKKVIVAITFGVMVTVAMFGFKADRNKEAKPLVNSYWRFNSGVLTDARDYTKYSKISTPSDAACGTGTNLPCVLVVDEDIDTPGELNAYLTDILVFPNDGSVTNSTPYKKIAD